MFLTSICHPSNGIKLNDQYSKGCRNSNSTFLALSFFFLRHFECRLPMKNSDLFENSFTLRTPSYLIFELGPKILCSKFPLENELSL